MTAVRTILPLCTDFFVKNLIHRYGLAALTVGELYVILVNANK